jgi:hypothetical protein
VGCEVSVEELRNIPARRLLPFRRQCGLSAQ